MVIDFDRIPDAGEERSSGSVLARIYHDIGLAAVAEALSLPADEFDEDMNRSLERGEFYLIPVERELAHTGGHA